MKRRSEFAGLLISVVLFLAGCGGLDESGKKDCESDRDCLDGYSCNAQGHCVEVKWVCDSGDSQDCICGNGVSGIQLCSGDGMSWEACECPECRHDTDCPDTMVCSQGECGCPTSEVMCGNLCVNLLTDKDNCGQCSNACGPDVECVNGQCEDPLAHCSNGIHDPYKGETDMDCGGPCPGCSYGRSCSFASDCAKGSCDENECREGTWISTADMPTPRQYLAAVYGPDGLIYAIGGIREVGGDNISGVVEAYNLSMDSWTTRAPLPTPRYGLAAVVGNDGRIYAIGGQYDDGNSPFTDGDSVKVEAYIPATNAWEEVPDLSNGRYKTAAVSVNDGLIYVIGGFSVNPIETLSTVSTYELGASSWLDSPDGLTTTRSSHAAAIGLDGKIYAIGGHNDGTEIDAFEYYEPGLVGWYTLPPMPTPRKDLAAATGIDGRIYVFGGNSRGNSNAVEIFDPGNHSWGRATSLPAGRYGHAAVTAPDGRIYIIGGRRAVIPPSVPNQTEQTGKVEVFVPDP